MVQTSALAAAYEVSSTKVHSSTQIFTRTSDLVSRLTAPPEEGSKAVIIALHAQARATNKLISIIEIAKRDLASKGIRCYQYNALSTAVIEIERKPNPPPGLDIAEKSSGEEGHESDDAFQTMGGTVHNPPRKRTVSVMTVYLSKTPVKDLRVEFGEQVL